MEPFGVGFHRCLILSVHGDKIYNVMQKFEQIDSCRVSDLQTLIMSSMKRQSSRWRILTRILVQRVKVLKSLRTYQQGNIASYLLVFWWLEIVGLCVVLLVQYVKSVEERAYQPLRYIKTLLVIFPSGQTCTEFKLRWKLLGFMSCISVYRNGQLGQAMARFRVKGILIIVPGFIVGQESGNYIYNVICNSRL